jgi:hypothetical protein
MRWACGMTTARARDRVAPDDFISLLSERLMPAAGTSLLPENAA